MSKKLHILFLSDFVPSPRSGSAASQLYAYYIEGLRRRGYDVSFVALARAHERHLADDLLQQVTYRQVVPIAQDLFARMGRLVRRVIDPAEYALVHSSGLDSILLDVMRRQRFDLIHANHPWLVHAARRALRRLSNAVRPVLIGQVMDIITALRFQHIYSAPRAVRPLYLLSFARAAYCEFINYSLTDGLIVHNTKDAEVIKILLPNSNNVFISPAWFDFIEEICDGYRERKGNKILFIGNFNDKRTKEGMAWFTDRVLPNLLQAINNLEVNLVGVKDKKSEDVFCTKEYIKCYGYQSHSDFLAFYDSASVLIFPLQFGRYSCHLKVLNAFARGLPVVMTSWANSGAEAVPGEEALVADTPEAFAECIIRLLRDPALAARIAEGGLRRIRREYPSPSVVLDSLEQAYQTAITQKSIDAEELSDYIRASPINFWRHSMNRSTLFRLASLLTTVGLTAMHLNTAHADLTDPSGYLVGTGNSSYSVMNTSSSTPATVVAEYYNTNGSPATSPQNLPSIPPLGRAAVALSSVPGLPSNWVGSIVLSADQDIVAAATTVYSGRNPVPDQSAPPSGNEAGAYEAFNTGSTTLFVPAIYRIPTANGQPARQASRYTIQNTTGSTANYTITYRSFAGVTIGTQTGTLQPYGWQTFRSWIDSEAPATNIAAFSAVINATQPLAGAAETLTNIGVPPILANWVGDYAMLTPNAAATVLYSPSAFRLCPNTPAAQANCANYSGINNFYTTFIQYSSFQLQNTTGNVANVTADFFYQPTGLISYTLNFTIAPFSSFGINLFNGGSLPLTHPIFPALGGRFFGSVRFTSDQPLVGVGNLDFPQTTVASYGSYNLVSDVDATNTVFAPVFVRICSASPCDQNNLQNFSRVSAIQVMNVGTVPVTLSSIDLITPTGSIALSLTTLPNGNPVTLAPGASVGLNLLNGGTWGNTYLVNNIVPAIGTNFQGSLRVTAPAGAKLKALVEWRDGNRGMDVFNAFNR